MGPQGRSRSAAFLLIVGFALPGCATLAMRLVASKVARPSTSDIAVDAIRTFWVNFLAARYENIPEVQRQLTTAYLQNPNDPKLALLLGHTHLWKVAERERATSAGPEITDHLILAERYFEEARRLAPLDQRIPGWLGGVKLALARIHNDERLKRAGYFMLKQAAADYPQFNGFSFSYPLIGQPSTSGAFKEAVEQMWLSAEICNGTHYDRVRPRFEYTDFASIRSTDERDRVCRNTPLAPHNMEGFFLHFGDILLKQGQLEAATAAYSAVKQIPEYATWSFKAALEERLANREDWSRRLRDDDPGNDPPYMLRSVMSCSGCHAR